MITSTCINHTIKRPAWIAEAEELYERDTKLSKEKREAWAAEEERIRKEKLEAPVIVEQEEN